MQKSILVPALKSAVTALICVVVFSQCCHNDQNKKNCEGYTGPVSGKSATSLITQSHFMIKDSIIAWTDRYLANKSAICNDSLPGVNNVLGYSSSFNRCIVKAIICNDSCIGLRVLFGMDASKRVHVILVGISPDYSNLYIKRPEECGSNPGAKRMQGASIDEGGAEYAQMP